MTAIFFDTNNIKKLGNCLTVIIHNHLEEKKPILFKASFPQI